MKYRTLFFSALATLTVLVAGNTARADFMMSIAINPATGAVTLTPRWAIGNNLAGFHFMAQDLSLGGGPNQFYSITSNVIPSGGDTSGFFRYIAAGGAATNHADIGSKLTPNAYSALTSADPDIGYGAINFYLIHHKTTGDYFTVIKPSSGTASAVTDLKPMSGPGGPATLGASGYFGFTFAAANLGYGLNLFYYLRTDPVTGFTKFGILNPALLGTSTDEFDFGQGGYNALTFTGTDAGYGTNKMYYLRLDPVTGLTILGTLDPVTGRLADIANLGGIYTTLDFVPGDVGFGSGRFYTTGVFNPSTWQSVSFAAIPDRALTAGSFTVTPSASSGLPITLTVVSGSATVSAPVAGVFTITPTAPSFITLQATQVGQAGVHDFNMLQQSFRVTGSANDFNGDGKSDILWENSVTGDHYLWFMNGSAITSAVDLGVVSTNWRIGGAGDFNGDGKADILWENTVSGDRYIWFMNGSTITSAVDLGIISTDWQVSGTGDLNGDGKADILWENTVTGDRYIWFMNGSAITSAVDLGVIATNWRMGGLGDLNGDGKADMLWENTSTGDRYIWFMNGSTITSAVDLGIISTDWRISGTGDFDGDGKADILWENTVTGDRYIWFMNGSTITSAVDLGIISTDWRSAK